MENTLLMQKCRRSRTSHCHEGVAAGASGTGPFANLALPFRNFAQNAVFEFNGMLPNNSLDFVPHCFRRELSKCQTLKRGRRTMVFALLTCLETITLRHNSPTSPMSTISYTNRRTSTTSKTQ